MDVSGITRMANQIADFFAASGHDEAVKGIAGHIRNFWDPRMRKALYAHVDKGGQGLEPLVVDAVVHLRTVDRGVVTN